MESSEEMSEFDKAEAEHDEACEAMRSKAVRSPSVTVPLSCPITFEGKEHASLKLRRPTAGDLIEASRHKMTPEEKSAFLLQRVASIPPEATSMLDLADFDLLEAAFEGFRGARVARTRPKGDS